MHNKNTMIKMPKELAKEIKKCKLVEGESYASVIKRLIDSERYRKEQKQYLKWREH